MLTVHHSNRLETLADELAAVTARPLASPFASEVVVVQSRGVARWLALRLASRTGVCANVGFHFPAAFAWELYRSVCSAVPEQSAFDPEILTWRIVGLLPQLEGLPEFAPVQGYVRGDHLRRFELASRLAGLFAEYLVYRPDWIVEWERNQPKHWQAALWRRLAQEADTPHAAALQRQLLQALAAPLRSSKAVPERVAIFAGLALPPTLLELFGAVARNSDVHLFVQNPCREYWGDIVGEGEIARKKLAGKSEAPYLDTGNSLLASFGKQGRDSIDLLTAVDGEFVQQIEHFVDPACVTLLDSIQADVLVLRDPAPGAPPHDDHSVQIHCCHSAMREIEVLHDQLLALLGEARDLEPADVVVMTPDIETYAPYIEAVFATAEPRIPFSISDRSAERESTLAATLLALLDLHASRYEGSRVLAVLDEPAVQRRFGLAGGDLDTVRRWVREAQIRWGIDADHRASFGLPATHEHTWRFGLDRLLLGYALPGGNERLFSGVLPYDEVEGSLAGVLGRFQSFAEAAIALDTQLAGMRSIAQWSELLHGVLERFFDAGEERAEELEAVRASVAALDRDSRAAGFTAAVPLAVVVTGLRERLEVPGRAFLSGGVTFCAMVPMRSLPFEVVCMVGMNDGAFPRMRRRDGFDLMAADFRKGDRSRRDDDRYLFLESMLSARRCLYISYTGRHIREDTVIPPSTVVSELIDYVARGYGRDASARLVTVHPLQAFSKRYFQGDAALFSYSQALARAASVAGRGTRTPQPFVVETLPAPDAESRRVDLESLISFFRNPARYLFRNRLNMRFESAEEELGSGEPFVLEPLTLYDLKQKLLAHRLSSEPYDDLALSRAAGVLPHGVVGDALFEDQDVLAGRFARQLEPLLPTERVEPIAFEIASANVTLTGTLAEVSRSGLVEYRLARVTANDRIKTWIRHLVLNAFAPPEVDRRSRCVAQDCILTFGPVAGAQDLLKALLELYWAGLHRPLPFFPKSACAYAESQNVAAFAVRKTWDGSGLDARGESDDVHYALAFRGVDPLDREFERIAMLVFGTMNSVLRRDALA